MHSQCGIGNSQGYVPGHIYSLRNAPWIRSLSDDVPDGSALYCSQNVSRGER